MYRIFFASFPTLACQSVQSQTTWYSTILISCLHNHFSCWYIAESRGGKTSSTERILDSNVRLQYCRISQQLNTTSISDRLYHYVDQMASITTWIQLPSDQPNEIALFRFTSQILTRHGEWCTNGNPAGEHTDRTSAMHEASQNVKQTRGILCTWPWQPILSYPWQLVTPAAGVYRAKNSSDVGNPSFGDQTK